MENQLNFEDFNKNPPKKISNKLIILAALALIVYGAFLIFKTDNENVQKIVEEIYTPSMTFASKFATYEEIPVNAAPSIPAYIVKKDLSNISNVNDFKFSEKQKDLLAQNAFVVSPSHQNEFFSLYESNRYFSVPNFITTDSMLHNYHLMFDYLLRQVEEQHLIAELRNLNKSMLLEALDQYTKLKETEWGNAAKRNVGFFATASKLLDNSIEIPSIVKTEVEQELSLIDKHEGLASSPMMEILEDYSQYIPRGHYDKTDELKAYFKSMMWYGRLTFKVKDEDMVKSALLMTLALDKGNNQISWDKIYEPTNFFVGKSDDITYYDFKKILKEAYGEASLENIQDKEKFASFFDLAKKLDPPQINSMPIFEAGLEPNREEAIKGFRFMGQRFTVDASIFQRLVYREVGEKGQSCNDYDPKEASILFGGARNLPKGLDIGAVLGSDEALDILDDLGETDYACYPENLSKMKNYISSLDVKTWTQNLYWGWLYQLRPLLSEKGEGYPSFMQNSAWARKELNTFLGSWTELKHDTILYAKQVYAELGGGGYEEEEKDDRGYVEPNAYVYARLASLLKMTREGLQERGLLESSMDVNLSRMEELAMSLKIISEKELNNEEITSEEYELIRSYGGQLEHFWIEMNKNEPAFQTMNKLTYLDQNPAAIVADVATDPNGVVLEEGTGKIFTIYAIIPIDGKLRITKGGVYSYYEFEWPMQDRLTDKKWRDMLNLSNAIELPIWTDAFIAE
ncbi:MAG: DUF3160 domain-containing protein [Candidatus Pacebacteria bacterium]|nr:DUF3160 domain-containing protein [Candidatus Paceibacterota bacterium]